MKPHIEGQACGVPRKLAPVHPLIVIAGSNLVATGFFFGTSPRTGGAMRLDRNGTLPTNKAPEENFTGDVYISGYFQREAPSRLAGATVAFTPGARTPWRVNPLGQTLIVTSGIGWMQCEGEEIVEIRAGDIIWCPPGHRHWDGAMPDHAMTYIAIQEAKDGKTVEFGEKVTGEEYQKGPPIASSRR